MPSRRSIMSSAPLAPKARNSVPDTALLAPKVRKGSRRGSGGFLLTLACVVEGGERHLQHVVRRCARGELLRPEHGKQQDLDHGIRAVPGHEADALESGPRDD